MYEGNLIHNPAGRTLEAVGMPGNVGNRRSITHQNACIIAALITRRKDGMQIWTKTILPWCFHVKE